MYFITGNKNKFDEVKSILNDVEQLDIDLPEIQDINPKNIIQAKLSEAGKHVEGEFIVEDVSLSFDCLNGLPGPLIKWFMKTLGNEGLYDIVSKFGNTNAVAKAVIGYMDKKGDVKFFEGGLNGKIVKPRGENGFGWDPIFEVSEFGKTFAEMTSEEKNKYSMRRLAINELKKSLS